MRIKWGYVIVLVLAGAAVAATPLIDGYCYKNSYTDLITAMGAGSTTKVKIVDYQLGWFCSDVQLSINLNAPDAKTQDPSLFVTVNQHITHGPLVKDPVNDGSWTMAKAAMQSQFHLDKKTEDKLIGSSQPMGIVQVDSLVSFDNHYQNSVKTALFSVKISETGKLTWQGVTGIVDARFIDNQLRFIKSDLSAGALSIQDATGNVAIQTMKALGQRDCQQAALCAGTSEFSVPSANGMFNNTSIKLVGTDIKTSYGLGTNNAYNANAEFALGMLTMPDYTVGPASIKVALNNMNPEALQKMLEIARSATEASSDDMQSQRLLMLAEYNKEIPHLITAGSVINQDTNINTSYGNFTSAAKFYWPANTPLPASSKDLVKMNFKVDMRAATTLVNQLVKVADGQMGSSDAATVAGVPAPAPVVAAPPPPPPPSAVPAPEVYTKTILDPFVATHKINADVIGALIAVQKQHLSPGIYSVSVDKIILIQRLPPALLKKVAQQLKDNYAATYSDTETEDTAAPAQAPAVAAAPAATATPVAAAAPAAGSGGRIQQQLDTMIKQGYVKQDNDDYVVSIVYENGAMNVNGVAVPLPAASSASAQ